MLQRGEAPIDAPQVRGDVRDADLVRTALDGCDAVVHAAAKVGIVGSWEDFRSINVDGTRERDRRGSRARPVAGRVRVDPVGGARRALARRCPRRPPVTGRTDAHYAESKAIAERLALGAASDALAGRRDPPAPRVGAGRHPARRPHRRAGAAGRLALVGGGTALIDTTYIDNAASALVAALDAAVPGAACVGRAYVIANGEPRPIRELIEGILPRRRRRAPSRRSCRCGSRSAPGRSSRRSGHAAQARRGATAHPVPRRAAGHRALVRSATRPRRPRLAPDGHHRRGPRRTRRLVRRPLIRTLRSTDVARHPSRSAITACRETSLTVGPGRSVRAVTESAGRRWGDRASPLAGCRA